MEETLWRGMNRAELDAAYNNGQAVAQSAAMLAEWTRRSAIFRSGHCAGLDLRYGDRPRNTIDLFRSRASHAPLLVFIHGGYWQRNSKEMFACLAAGPLAAGFDVAMIGYTLCPIISLMQLVAEIEAAMDWLGTHARQYGVTMDRVIVSGWSAGAHLAAMLMNRDEVDAGLLISGIFDLEPCRLNYLNQALRLMPGEAHLLSPLHHIPASTGPLSITYGLDELPELRRQSCEYAARWQDAGLSAQLVPLAHDHFSILHEIERHDGRLVKALAELVDLT
jgi:arylformamidase